MGCAATRNFTPEEMQSELERISNIPGDQMTCSESFFLLPRGATLPEEEGLKGTKRYLGSGTSLLGSSALLGSSVSCLTPREQPPSPSATYPGSLECLWTPKYQDADLAKLVSKGFDTNLALQMLDIANGDVDFAYELLMTQRRANTPGSEKKRFSFKNVKRQPTTENGEESSERPPRDNEVDYALHFEPPTFGFEIKSGFNNKNAIVARATGSFASERIMPGSLIVAVGKECVIGWTLEKIRDKMKTSMENGIVKMTFRAKRDLWDKFWVSGNLIMQILGGQALRSQATWAAVRVNHATLAIEGKSAPSKNPIWNETVCFQNLMTGRIGQGSITVYRSGLTGSVEIGSAWFDLPMKTNEIQESVLELRDRRGNIAGLVPIKMMLKSNKF